MGAGPGKAQAPAGGQGHGSVCPVAQLTAGDLQTPTSPGAPGRRLPALTPPARGPSSASEISCFLAEPAKSQMPQRDFLSL